MPSHQNHHYVPAFLLREWQQADNKLTQFTWENNRFITSRRQAKWAAAGFKDTLLRLSMKQEIANGNEKAIQSGVQG
jgi:hypothetical protein